MNTSNFRNRPSSAYPTPAQLAHYEREAQRLRAEFIADAATGFVVAFDQLIRRTACRIAARLFGSDCRHAPAR